MIASLLAKQARARPERMAIVTKQGGTTYAELEAQVDALARALETARGNAVALQGSSNAWTSSRLLALDRLGARIHLLPSDLDPAGAAALCSAFGISGTLREGESTCAPLAPVEGEEPGLVLYTSGTTGVPKAVLHDWVTLADRIRVRPELDGSRWLLAYSLTAFAGLQVMLHALMNGGTLVVGDDAPGALLALAARERVTHVSATPTFLRFALATAPARAIEDWAPTQITLGGEAVDQPILDGLHRRFPHARISHLYASTEMGACFAVHDRLAGFPSSYLDDPALEVELRIRDGELWIRSPRRMRTYLGRTGHLDPEGFFATGDQVELRGGRVHFLGRQSERINVGGQKVFPGEVEAVILELPGVRAVRVSGASSSLAGALVCAEVVAGSDVTTEELRAEILRHCRARLAPYKIPRRLAFVSSLEQTASGKLVRKG